MPVRMQNIKILYVEDEPFLGKIVRESLESRAFDSAGWKTAPWCWKHWSSSNPTCVCWT